MRKVKKQETFEKPERPSREYAWQFMSALADKGEDTLINWLTAHKVPEDVCALLDMTVYLTMITEQVQQGKYPQYVKDMMEDIMPEMTMLIIRLGGNFHGW